MAFKPYQFIHSRTKCILFKQMFSISLSFFRMIRLSVINNVRWKTVSKDRFKKAVEAFVPNTNKVEVESKNDRLKELHQKFDQIRSKSKTDKASDGHMEWFFKDPSQVYGQSVFSQGATSNTVIHGLAWPLHILRALSLKELHRLWYVLLIEKNRLFAIRHEYIRNNSADMFPSPMRLEYTAASMDNIRTVIEEREKAKNSLVTGSVNKIPGQWTENFKGEIQKIVIKIEFLLKIPVTFHEFIFSISVL